MRRLGFGLGVILFALCLVMVGTVYAADKKFVIGSIQIMSHPDLDNSFLGIQKALEEAGFKDGVNVQYLRETNPSGKPDDAKLAIDKFVEQKVDMIIAITAPCAASAIKATSTIPIVFAAVRDPVELGIVKSIANPGGNATGGILVYPIYNLISIVNKILPSAHRITFIEDKNKSLKADAEQKLLAQAKASGLEMQTIYISSKDEVPALFESLKGKTDCVMVNNNMEVIKAMDDIIRICLENKIPLVTANEPSVEKGALATSVMDYFKEGIKVGNSAVAILKGEKQPSDIPVIEPTINRVVINLNTAKIIGINIPIEFLKIADKTITTAEK